MSDARQSLRLETRWTIFTLILTGLAMAVVLALSTSSIVKIVATFALVLQLGTGVLLLLWHPSRLRMDDNGVQWRDNASQRLQSMRFSDVHDVVWQDTFSVCVGTEKGERLIPLAGLDAKGREALMARLNERQLEVRVT